MPKIIEVPGQGKVSFPDSMNEQEISDAVQKLSGQDQAQNQPQPGAQPQSQSAEPSIWNTPAPEQQAPQSQQALMEAATGTDMLQTPSAEGLKQAPSGVISSDWSGSGQDTGPAGMGVVKGDLVPGTLEYAKVYGPSATGLPEDEASYRTRASNVIRSVLGMEKLDTQTGMTQSEILQNKARAEVEHFVKTEGGKGVLHPMMADQFVSHMVHTTSFGLIPEQVRPPLTTSEQVAGGLGDIAGLIAGPAKLATAVKIPYVESLLGAKVGGQVATEFGKQVATQSLHLAKTLGLASAGEALDQNNLKDALGVIAQHTEEGAKMGAVFGGVTTGLPQKGLMAAAARFGLTSAMLDLMNGARPWDQRELAQKVFDYGLNALFTWKGTPLPREMAPAKIDFNKAIFTPIPGEKATQAQPEAAGQNVPRETSKPASEIRSDKIRSEMTPDKQAPSPSEERLTTDKIPQEVQDQMQKIPDKPENFFNRTNDTIDIPMNRVKSPGIRPAGVLRGNKKMMEAADGSRTKRKPVEVYANGDGTFEVKDGNSTVANAKFSGWKSIPARIVPRDIKKAQEKYEAKALKGTIEDRAARIQLRNEKRQQRKLDQQAAAEADVGALATNKRAMKAAEIDQANRLRSASVGRGNKNKSPTLILRSLGKRHSEPAVLTSKVNPPDELSAKRTKVESSKRKGPWGSGEELLTPTIHTPENLKSVDESVADKNELRKKKVQITNSRDELIYQAKDSENFLGRVLRKISDDVGGVYPEYRAKVDPNKVKPDKLERIDVKGDQAVKDKAGRDPNTGILLDQSQRRYDMLYDYLGGRIVVPNMVKMQEVVDRLAADPNLTVMSYDNKISRPQGGYRAIHVDVKLPNGLITEIQVMTNEMRKVVDDNHKLYENWRNHTNGVPALEKAKYFLEMSHMEQTYQDAWMKDILADPASPGGHISIPLETLVREHAMKNWENIKTLDLGSSTSLNMSMKAFETAHLKQPEVTSLDAEPVRKPDGTVLYSNPIKAIYNAWQETADILLKSMKDLGGYKFAPLGNLPNETRYTKMRNETVGKITQAEKIAEKIYSAFRAKEDSPEVYKYLTTKGALPDAIKDPQVRSDAIAVKKLIDKVGRGLVDRGLLSEETFLEHRGSYLPRIYLKHLLGESAFKALGAGKKPSDLGYLKKRQDIPEEIRKVILGEITDPGFLASRGTTQAMRDMHILDFLGRISETKDWVYKDSLVDYGGKKVSVSWMTGEANRLEQQAAYMDGANKTRALDLVKKMRERVDQAKPDPNQNLEDFRQVPDTARYGRLRGMKVRKEIYNDLIGSINVVPAEAGAAEKLLGMGGTLTKVTQLWKMSKVALNPPTQVRNAMSNGILLHLSGVPFARVPDRTIAAVHDIATNGKYWRIAKKHGVLGGTFASNELRRIQRDLLDLESRMSGGNPFAKMRKIAGVIGDTAGDAYQLSEYVFKVAKIKDAMEREGLSEADAVIEAQKWLFDYSMIPESVRYLRNAPTGIPFMTFYYKAAPRMAEVMLKHPTRLLPYYAMMAGLQAYLAADNDVSTDDIKALQKALPQWLQDRGNAMILPYKDKYGRWQALDVGYYFPWTIYTGAVESVAKGDVAGLVNNFGLLGGPIPDLIAAIKTGKDSFTGKDIFNPLDPAGKQAGDLMNYLWRMSMPTFMTDIGFAGHMYKAITGAVDRYGNPKDTLTQAALRIAGVNLYPIEPDRSRRENVRRMIWEKKEIQRRMKSQLRDRNLTPKQRDRVRSDYRELLDAQQKRIEDYRKQSHVNPKLRAGTTGGQAGKVIKREIGKLTGTTQTQFGTGPS